MKSRRHGSASIGRIDDDGLELFVDGELFHLCYEAYPWFRGAPEDMVRAVKIQFHDSLHWEDLDVDLHVDSLRHPEKYPRRFDPNPAFAKWVAPRVHPAPTAARRATTV